MELIINELLAGVGDARELTRSLLRVSVALLCGALIGYERERVGKAAGLRTHILVAGGTALVIAAVVEADFHADAQSRVIQGLVTGIGFLGAGTILKREDAHTIHGLTTAAGLWMTSAIGVTAGLGRFGTAAAATVFAWGVLSLLRRLEPPNHGASASSPYGEPGTAPAKETDMDNNSPTHAEPPVTNLDKDDGKETHVENLIDESMEESFPASDPPAVTPRKAPVDIPADAQDSDSKDKATGGSKKRP